jgi:hypothetical protein
VKPNVQANDPPINPLNAELNPIRHLLALPGAHHFVDVSRIRVNINLQISASNALVCNNGGAIHLKDFEEVVVVCTVTTVRSIILHFCECK